MKMPTRGAALAALTLAAAVGLAACSGSSSGGGGTGGSTAPSAGKTNSSGGTSGLVKEDINPQPVSKLKQGGTVIWGLDQYSSQWNVNEVDGLESSTVNVMDSLMPVPFVSDSNAKTTPNPNYITSAKQVSASPQTIDLTLNPKAVWSDGSSITEADYAAEYMALNGKNKKFLVAGSTGWNQIASVTQGSSGKFSVVIKFATPFSDWEGLLGSSAPLYPAKYNSTPAEFNTGYLNKIPVTAGPFGNPVFNKSAQTVTVTPNPKWWGRQARARQARLQG